MAENFPFGYRFALAPYEPEQKVLGLIKKMATNGTSQREIAKVLNDRGIKFRGRLWHQGTISRILQREGVE